MFLRKQGKSGNSVFLSTVNEQGFEGCGARVSLGLHLMHSFIHMNKADVCKIPENI
jgi:hypothetical protein